MKEELRIVLENMGRKLSEEKTKVTHITEGFTFLGFRIVRERGTSGKMVPRGEIPEAAIKKFRHKVRGILAPATCKASVNAKILALNQCIRGWCNYYRCPSVPSKPFSKLKHEVYWDMAHWLGRKYERNMPEVLQRYKEGQTFLPKSNTLVMPSEIKAKKLLVKTWHHPYTAKEEIRREQILFYEALWIGTEDRLGWRDLREEVILLKGTTCYVCGRELHPSEVEVDHATKPRAAFKDKSEADRLKHLQPICTSCHRAKTKTDREVLSRRR
jgi:hypothetical protein